MEKMKRIKKRLSLTLRPSLTIDESLSELAEQMTIEDGGTKDNGRASTQRPVFTSQTAREKNVSVYRPSESLAHVFVLNNNKKSDVSFKIV